LVIADICCIENLTYARIGAGVSVLIDIRRLTYK
jgi:hypothetical protein